MSDMPVTPITPAQTDALAKLAEIPPVGSEERNFWLMTAERHGFRPLYDDLGSGDSSWSARSSAILTLMSEARKQGQRDCLGASSETTELLGKAEAASHLHPSGEYFSRGLADAAARTDALTRLSTAATPGPWAYRPEHLDDWGYIRSTVIDNPALKGKVVATTRGDDHDTFDAHREAGTDPYEANGRFIVALVNAYRAGQLVPAFAVANPSGGWRPIETAPDEGEFLVGLRVRRHDPITHELVCEYEEQHIIAIDDETGEIDFAYEQGWRLSDYEFWKPLDPLPSVSDRSGEAVETTGSTEGKSTADLSATPEVNPSLPLPNPPKGQEETPCPMTVEEAREVLDAIGFGRTPQQEIIKYRRASLGMTRPENADKCLAKAERIELALSTIRASEEDR